MYPYDFSLLRMLIKWSMHDFYAMSTKYLAAKDFPLGNIALDAVPWVD